MLVTEHKYYVSGDIVISHRSNNTKEYSYLHKDHQGSIVAVTNVNGTIIQQAFYDPFGKRTQVYQYSKFANASFIQPTDRGYTGHNMMDGLGIIHMNGRIYDPTLGRFLQADPHIQAPMNSQNYNRYSYVLNNPMSYTDPSGYFFKSLFKGIKKYWRVIAAAAVTWFTAGAVSGWATSWAAGAYGAGTTAAAVAGGALTGAIAGAAGGLVATGSLRGTLVGAFSGAAFGAIGGYFKATGGVGSIAVMILSKFGYNVTAVTGKKDKTDYLKQLGAKNIIDRKELEGEPKVLGKGLWDGVVDTVGGVILSNAISQTKHSGIIAMCGNAANINLNTTVMPFILRGVKLWGIDSVMVSKKRREFVWSQVVDLIDFKFLEEHTKIVNLEELLNIFPNILKGEISGRVIVDVNK